MLTDDEAQEAKIRSIIESIKIPMVTSFDAQGKMRARPMYMMKLDTEGSIWFVTSKETDKVDEIDNNPSVSLTYAEPKSTTFLAIQGKATIETDQRLIDKIYTPIVEAWYPNGKKENRLCLLKVEPEVIEYWNGSSSRIWNGIQMIVSVLLGERHKSEHNKIIVT